MLVVDTTALIEALVGIDPPPGLRERLGQESCLHAPYLIDVEMLHALRRFTRRAVLSMERADEVRAEYATLAITRYPHLGLADRIWALRHNLSAYDATYVALAEALDAPLITCDRRLGAASGHCAVIETFPFAAA